MIMPLLKLVNGNFVGLTDQEIKTMRTKEQILKRISFIDTIMNIQKVMIDYHFWKKENGTSIILSYKEEKDKLQKELEELSKPKRWKPRLDEKYYYISDWGKTLWSYYSNDEFRYKTRNCFKTKEEAEEELERILFVNEVRDFIEEENDGWEFDLLKHREFYYINKYVSGSGKEILIEVEYSMNYNQEWFQGTSDYKIFKSKEIGEKILAKFDNQKLIRFWI